MTTLSLFRSGCSRIITVFLTKGSRSLCFCYFSVNTFYNTITRLGKKTYMVLEATRLTMDVSPEIVPLSLVSESHLQMSDSARELQADVASSGETLTIMVNGCNVAIINNACKFEELMIIIQDDFQMD